MSKTSAAEAAEAERAIIGAILLEPGVGLMVAAKMHPTDFGVPEHQVLAKAIIDMVDRQVGVDSISLLDHLANKGLIEQAGGQELVLAAGDWAISAVNIEHHVEIALEASRLRKFQRLLSRAYRAASEALRGESDQVIEEQIAALLRQTIVEETGGAQTLGQLLKQNLVDIRRIHENPDQGTPYPTGLLQQDDMCPYFRGNLHVWAAHSGYGKTAKMVSDAIAMARINPAVRIAYFTTEVQPLALGRRWLANDATVNGRKFTRGGLLDGDISRLQQSIQNLKTTGVVDSIVAQTLHTVESIARNTHRLKRLHGLDIVFVDYLQRLRSSSFRTSGKTELVEHVAGELKQLALNADVCVVTGAQYNRDAAGRQDHRPQLTDIRNSSAIEHEADILMLGFPPAKFDESADPNMVQWFPGKVRDDASDGILHQQWQPQFQRFSEPGNDWHG